MTLADQIIREENAERSLEQREATLQDYLQRAQQLHRESVQQRRAKTGKRTLRKQPERNCAAQPSECPFTAANGLNASSSDYGSTS